MVRAWFMDDNQEVDQREEHQLNPAQPISMDKLRQTTGVEYFAFDVETYATDAKLTEIRKDRGYSYDDEITCSEKCLPDYVNKIKSFFMEHLHSDEEIRFVLDGSGYFDVRDKTDKWIRIEVLPGDMIIIPSGIYHRFTLDTKNYIKAKRFFVGEPVWTPYNRPVDEMDCRKAYVERLSAGFA